MTDEEFDALKPGDLIVPFSYGQDPLSGLIYVILERGTLNGAPGYHTGKVHDPKNRRRATQEFASLSRFWSRLVK